jgi:DNA-binding response OmpR family regulator
VHPRILLLEDDGAFALDVKRALAPMGCEVTVVAEGNTGLARAVSDRFDLIILSAELRG